MPFESKMQESFISIFRLGKKGNRQPGAIIPKTTAVCPNFKEIEIGALTLYQSYETVVGFRLGSTLVVIQNYWGTTTGKHLNKISRDHKIRVSEERFLELWQEVAEPFLFGKGEAPTKLAAQAGRRTKSIIV